MLRPEPEATEKLILQPDELATCVVHLSACKHFGLDTEFVGEDSYHPRLCLVQLATEDTLYLIDPLTVGPLDAFWNLGVDPANQVIVHAGREEARLCHRWSGRTPGKLFDLQIAAGLVGLLYPLGHGPLVNKVLGVQLAKGETLTEWRHRPLTRSQICYALDDVRYLLPVWHQLSERLEKLQRTNWALEEFARLMAQATTDLPESAAESERWRKLKSLGTLDRRRLAIVRELYHWREQTAAQTNRPARVIVRDDLLIEIARRGPSKAKDLHVVRGLAKRFGDDIVKVVERAKALPLDECPTAYERELDPPQVGLIVNVLGAALADFAGRNHLAANLVAGAADLRGLVTARLQKTAPPTESLLFQGWRAAHVLPELEAILEGRRSLRVADLASETPFAYGDA